MRFSKMKSSWKILFSILLIFSILIISNSCEKDPVKPEEDTGPGIPEKFDDGWEISTPTIQGMDIEKIRALSTKIHNGDYNKVDGFLIVRNDKLIWEEYFNGYRVDRLHRCYSVTKSVNSALIGIAIENGVLENVDQTIKNFFPEYADIINQSERKKKLNLFHLLTMTDGLEWDELSYPYSDSRNSYSQWTGHDDRIRYVFERSARSEPGTHFAYNSGISVILGEILHRATEYDVITFAQKNLFAPLGITDFNWSTIYSKYFDCSCE